MVARNLFFSFELQITRNSSIGKAIEGSAALRKKLCLFRTQKDRIIILLALELMIFWGYFDSSFSNYPGSR